MQIGHIGRNIFEIIIHKNVNNNLLVFLFFIIIRAVTLFYFIF